MSTCRHCNGSFDAKAWQIAKSDYECPPCRRARQVEWRANRKQEGRPVISVRMPRDYHSAYEKTYFEVAENRDRRNALMRAYTKSHATRDHHKARWQVRRAIKTGRLNRQPCEVCGSEKVHAHHDDYSQPLAVRWLCQKHHCEHHAKATGEQA